MNLVTLNNFNQMPFASGQTLPSHLGKRAVGFQ